MPEHPTQHGDTEMTDWRGLCEELVEAMASTGEAASGSFADLLDRARAALAQPEPEVVGPTDKELDALWFEIDGRLRLGWKSFARAVLARWGNHFPDVKKMVSPAPVTAEGEVVDEAKYLVRELRDQADDLDPSLELFELIHRAANLLEQYQAAPVPAEAKVEKAPAVTEVIAWLRTEAEIDDGFELTQSAAYQRRAADLLERQASAEVSGVEVLSPAAQGVKDAFDSKWAGTRHQALVAALRAAADHIEHSWDGMECVDHLQAIAAELEDHDG